MIARLLLLLGSLLCGLLLLEGGLRLALLGSLDNPRPSSGLTQAHPTRGWALVPGAQGLRSDIDYRVDVRINSQGLRDVEHTPTATPGVRRIVVLGDSFMEAYQVELEESLPRRLEAQLGSERVEVINLGVGGYGTAQESLALDEQGLRFAPDVVVLAFYADNDVHNNSQVLEGALWGEHLKAFGRPYAVQRGDTLSFSEPPLAAASAWIDEMRRQDAARAVSDQLLFVDLGRSLLGRVAHWLGDEVFPYDPNLVLGVYATRFDPSSSPAPWTETEYRNAWERAWATTQAIILRIARVAEQSGARFVLMSIPSKFQADAVYRDRVSLQFPRMKLDPTLPNERLQRFARANDLWLLDLGPAMAAHHEAGEAPLYYGFRDRHWNAAGHDFAARELAAFLTQHDLLR